MVSAPWVFYALAMMVQLPFLSIATPTTPAILIESLFTEPTPPLHEVLEIHPDHHQILTKTPGGRQCISVRWEPVQGVLSFDNSHGANLIIIIETNQGVVLCFVPSSDMEKIMPAKTIKQPEYQSLFADRLLRTMRDLIVIIIDIENLDLELNRLASEGTYTPASPLRVFSIQVASPRKTRSSFTRSRLVDQMVSDLKSKVQATLNPLDVEPDFEIRGFTYDPKNAGTVAIWKYLSGDKSHKAKIWITGAYEARSEPIAGIYLDMRAEAPDQEQRLWSTFGAQSIKYRLPGTILPHASKHPSNLEEVALLDLCKENVNSEERLKWAKQTKWTKYDDTATDIHCDQVPWEKDGSLLCYINEKTSPVLMIQTVTAAIMCYLPIQQWTTVAKEWRTYRRSRQKKRPSSTDYDNELELLLRSLQPKLEGLRKEPNIPDGILGAQFTVGYTLNDINLKPLVNNVLLDMRNILLKAMEGPTNFHIAVDPYLYTLEGLKKADKKIREPASDFRYSAMWLPPLAEAVTPNEVSIWTMGRGGKGWTSKKGKRPSVKLDLLKAESEDPYSRILPPTKLE